uniref:SCP domain-containing protein n=1 Tax=Panagrolaimus davidi TaxID=227884 RepID=A0A914PHR2_9BILA
MLHYPTDSTAYDYSTVFTTSDFSFSPSESTYSDSSSYPTDSTSSDFSTDSPVSDSSYFPTDSTVSVFPTDSTTSDSSNYPTDATASDSSTDSSAFPTQTSTSQSNSPTPYTSSLKPTPTTPPPPPPHKIVYPKRKHPILRKQKPRKISNFKDDDSVECKSSTLTADYRQQILDAHNEFRSTLANGMAELPDGKFAPSASNMYKLKYSCKLEAMAQKWLNQEIFQYNENQKIIPGENLYLKWSQKDNLEDDAINEISMKIYEIGNPCKKDSECSEKPKSICDVDTGLCYAN